MLAFNSDPCFLSLLLNVKALPICPFSPNASSVCDRSNRRRCISIGISGNHMAKDRSLGQKEKNLQKHNLIPAQHPTILTTIQITRWNSVYQSKNVFIRVASEIPSRTKHHYLLCMFGTEGPIQGFSPAPVPQNKQLELKTNSHFHFTSSVLVFFK